MNPSRVGRDCDGYGDTALRFPTERAYCPGSERLSVHSLQLLAISWTASSEVSLPKDMSFPKGPHSVTDEVGIIHSCPTLHGSL